MSIRFCGFVALGLALSACSSVARNDSGNPSYQSAHALGLTSCPRDVVGHLSAGSAATAWREVQRDNFRYCVPSHWVEAHGGWQGDGGVLVAVQATPDRIEKDFPRAHLFASPKRNYEHIEIGGAVAEVWDQPAIRRSHDDRQELFETGAVWRDHSTYLSGRAQTRAAVQLHKQVFRTVRFVPGTAR